MKIVAFAAALMLSEPSAMALIGVSISVEPAYRSMRIGVSISVEPAWRRLPLFGIPKTRVSIDEAE